MKRYNIIDYVSKYTTIQDKDIEFPFDYIVGEITRKEAIKQVKQRKEACLYYRIQAYFGRDKEL